MPQWKKGMVIPGLMIAVVVGLMFKEPDVGNALVIGSVGCMVLLIAGMRVKYFLPPVLIALTALGIFIYHNPMRSERIYSWLHLEGDKKRQGLQAYEAMIALGSGGPSGKGLGDSRQSTASCQSNTRIYSLDHRRRTRTGGHAGHRPWICGPSS